VRAVPVVEMKPGFEVGGTLRGVKVSASVGPFAQGGLDEAFGFAIGARGIRASKEMA
jgi:hypothetical protein